MTSKRVEPMQRPLDQMRDGLHFGPPATGNVVIEFAERAAGN